MSFSAVLRWVFVAAATLCVAAAASPVLAGARLPEISQTDVYRLDVVAAAFGRHVVGSPEFAHREGTTIHYFVNNENREKYIAHPKAFPNIEKPVRLAFIGGDIVLRYPDGVHRSAYGPLMAGDPTKYTARYKDAVFAFENKVTVLAFKRDPTRYVPQVGGYCLAAMSNDRVTPGNPRHTFFVPENKTWTVFGSSRGPSSWAAMTSTQRQQKLKAAWKNYDRRTGITPADATIATEGELVR